MRIRRIAALAAAVALATAACGGDDDTPSGEGGGGDKGSIVVGSANFGEAQIIASMYAQVLSDAGYDVSTNLDLGSRELYIEALRNGEVDVLPEYIGTLSEYFNTRLNGPEASLSDPVATGDPEETYANLQSLLDEAGGLEVTDYAPDAANQNSFAVTEETAEQYDLETLSDLAKPEVANELVLGAGADCETRPFCLKGLEEVYEADFEEADGKYKKFASPGGQDTINALTDGSIDIGLVFTTDGSVEDAGLVRLEDDKNLQPAENICALSTEGTLDEEAVGLIEEVNQTLTTEDLKELNRRFSVDKEDAEDIAADYVSEHDLA